MKKKIEFKLDEDLFNEYKNYCEQNGYDMSKRLRLFIESEIPVKYNEVFIDDIKYEPSIEFEKIDIMGKKFTSTRKTPNIFVIKSESKIEGNIFFYLNNKKYELDDVIISDIINGYNIIECRKFKIKYNDF